MLANDLPLKYSAYAIAAFDLASAVLISAMALKMMVNNLDWTGWFLFAFSVFWVSVVILLLVGIARHRPRFVYSWVIFSCFGIGVEIILILYGVFENATINWHRFKGVVLLFAGLAIESIFVYLIYCLYLQLQRKCPHKRKRFCGCFRRRSRASSRTSKSSKRDKKKSKKKPKQQVKCKKVPRK